MSILVLVDYNGASIDEGSLSAITAALQIENDVDLLIAGENIRAAAEAASKIKGINKVLLADAPAYAHSLAENITPLIVKLLDNYQVFVASANSNGKNIAPRVAALLDTQQISEIITVVSPDTFRRPIYAGNAIATVQSVDAKKVVTVRATAFEKAEAEGGSAPIEAVEATEDTGLSRFVSVDLQQSGRADLNTAPIVVSGGRALGSPEKFHELIEGFADCIHAAVGASRAAVDAEYAPNDCQVGQTGKIVAPEVYIAVGISGAIQHLAGMKDSRKIAAINIDPEAPIFQIADIALVGDLFEIMPSLIEKF
ncbi:MAG: FAD-binding protein [Zymomonas mobilis subsp. pomaceae]|uniref:Electron transfer flavoprotein subunit alpha n=1 Tax=Zymomonas mobilis subsp. pomaceae (strain ATCC 29192 / DSM 22645 / JCM 10191 / CCUG 17912 / NBRC 13757 / NCIMB 11200 / NRRL B-4491 / Barker I) TaxID=579138 RepID=F8EW92_ZYMMT|nr:FAD-binding protein [Zymomonas mobilis]AEI38502.1 Electron transfer flavoprotein alpha subunit [Zymomonas mobilis subsp. pomaceae ATCC 29192]MDX5948191.1 FAD-binding protein [Zymomonas mobilis subsp. pomaceae]GEB89869.1 electron transfer flavoprotein subunit alpha [Zymomonas mobilis subsp. pomaceae]